MRLEVSVMADAPVEEVWEWWTDYGRVGEESDVSHGFAIGRRRVLERDDSRVVLEERLPLPLVDHIPLLRHAVEMHAKEHRMVETAESPIPYVSTWTFVSAGNGTQITRVIETEAPAARFAPVPVLRKFIERDLKHHVKDMERERASR